MLKNILTGKKWLMANFHIKPSIVIGYEHNMPYRNYRNIKISEKI
jgi:hypothetical protein